MTAGKQIASATAWLTLSNAAVRLISLVTMPVLTRLLPAQAYGGASLAGTMISLLSVLFMAGIDMSYARSYFATTGPGGKEVEAFVWRYAVLAALASGVVGGLIWFVVAPFFQLDRSLAGIVGAGAILSFLGLLCGLFAQTLGDTEFDHGVDVLGLGGEVLAIGLGRRFLGLCRLRTLRGIQSGLQAVSAFLGQLALVVLGRGEFLGLFHFPVLFANGLEHLGRQFFLLVRGQPILAFNIVRVRFGFNRLISLLRFT